MAQKRYFNFKDDDKTDWLNRQLLGPVPAGVYTGFDWSNASSGTNLVLSHVASPFKETRIDLTVSPPLGCLRTKQGVTIIEDADVTVPLASVNTVSLPRKDLVVCEHTYVAAPGGVAATYFTIPGIASSNPVLPALTFPEKQIIVGILEWDTVGASVRNARFIKSDIPEFGNSSTVVRTNKVQVIDARKQIYHQIGQLTFMGVNVGNSTMYATISSNFYFIQKTDNAYQVIKNVDIPFTGDGNYLTVFTSQKLILDNTNGAFHLADGASQIHIPENTSFMLLDSAAFTNVVTGKYIVVTGAEVHKDAVSKMFRTLGLNKGSAIVADAVGAATLDHTGNYYEIDCSAGGSLSSLTYLNNLMDPAIPRTAGGAVYYLRLYANPGTTNISIVHNGAGVPSQKKNIITPTGTNLSVVNGAYVVVVEDESNFKVLSYIDSVHNFKTLDDFVNTEHQFTKMQTFNHNTLLGIAGGGVGYDYTNSILVIDGSSNSYTAFIPTNGLLKDIKIKRGSAAQTDCPIGTKITVQFIYDFAPPVGYTPFKIDFTGNIQNPYSTDNAMQSTQYNIADAALQNYNAITFLKTNVKWVIVDDERNIEFYSLIKANADSITALKNVPAWIAVGQAGSSFGTNWGIGNVVAKFRKDAFGLVSMTGRVQNSTQPPAVPAANILTLPNLYRPTAEVMFPCSIIYPGNTIATNYHLDVRVDTNGKLIIEYNGTNWASAGYQIDLSPIRFYIT